MIRSIFFLLTLLILFEGRISFAQIPTLQWSHCFGGSQYDIGYDVEVTNDNCFLVISNTLSNDGDIVLNHGSADVWVIKLDSTGNTMWQRSYGGSNGDGSAAICKTYDGMSVIGGGSSSIDGDLTFNQGSADYWVFKIDNVGNIVWQNTYGGSGPEFIRSIWATSDSGFVAVGDCDSDDGDVTGHHGVASSDPDIWVIKIDSLGQLVWQKSLGGIYGEEGYGVCQNRFGDYYIAGNCAIPTGDVTANYGGFDFWIVKLNDQGNIIWERSLGGSSSESPNSILPTWDGGCIVTGESSSIDGDVTGNHGGADVWVVKIDSSGVIQWQRSYGGSGGEGGWNIRKTNDGGYVVLAGSSSMDGEVSGQHGFLDFWLFKIDSLGNLLWQNCFGGSLIEQPASVAPIDDENFMLVGYTYSNDGDVFGNHVGTCNQLGDTCVEIWVAKVDVLTSVNEIKSDKDNLSFPNPVINSIHLDSLEIDDQINIVNLFGNICFQTTASTTNMLIDVSDLPCGMYLIQIANHKSIRFVKL